MNSYPKVFSFDINDYIQLVTNLGKEEYQNNEIKQIILRKKRRVYHHKLVYAFVILIFSVASILFENSIILIGILVIFSVFWILPKYVYYLKLNFAINSKKYIISQKQFLEYKQIVQSFNKLHKSSNV